jgi:Zn-dependent protease with chaperone function
MILVILDAAIRGLVLALAVWAGLVALRVRNVMAQKVAWGLVLAAALLMPWLAPLAVHLRPFIPAVVLPARFAPSPAPPAVRVTPNPLPVPASVAQPLPAADRASLPVSHQVSTPAEPAPQSRVSAVAGLLPQLLRWLLPLYLLVAAVLLARLVWGAALALRLWRRAVPVPAIAGGPVRVSSSVAAPITVGSGIVLPLDFAEWDAEKLRIVLAHEGSHVRQGDFYLQLLASLYAALVWFSPLGWWLKRRLSDLSETICDRAGLEHAPNCGFYAQILLEFAAQPRQTSIGVAMARSTNLSTRIERFLNENSFRQAFAGNRRRMILAALLVPVALVVATSLVRVEASPVSASLAAYVQSVAPAVAEQPAAPPEPAAPANAAQTPAPEADTTISSEPSPSVIHNGSGFSWGTADLEHFTGNWNEGANLEKARKLAHGKFLWFEKDGKSYLLNDPAVVAQLEEMSKPMKSLSLQQETLGRAQKALGKQQGELGRQMEQASVPTPDMSKEIAELEQQMTKLRAMQGKNMTTEEWGEIQGKLGDLQGKLGAIQGEIGGKQGAVGAKMGALGAEQGKLGAQQGKLGAEQGRLAQEMDRRAQVIIDQALHNGTAQPIK